MKKVKSPIRTIGVGWVGGIAILLLVAGYKGQRYVVPSCRICISPDPNESNLPILASTPFDDVIRETHAHLMQHTSITEQDLLRLEKRPLTPLEAIELGFADHLMESDFLEV